MCREISVKLQPFSTFPTYTHNDVHYGKLFKHTSVSSASVLNPESTDTEPVGICTGAAIAKKTPKNTVVNLYLSHSINNRVF